LASVPAFLVSERVIHANGTGEAAELNGVAPLLITLGVLEVVEQESLLLTIEGSTDGSNWTPLVSFPEKFYTGVSAVYLDPGRSAVHSIRAAWKVNRWGRGDKTPSFRAYVFAELV
jgi:hypothetical protein